MHLISLTTALLTYLTFRLSIKGLNTFPRNKKVKLERLPHRSMNQLYALHLYEGRRRELLIKLMHLRDNHNIMEGNEKEAALFYGKLSLFFGGEFVLVLRRFNFHIRVACYFTSAVFSSPAFVLRRLIVRFGWSFACAWHALRHPC